MISYVRMHDLFRQHNQHFAAKHPNGPVFIRSNGEHSRQTGNASV